MTKFLSAFYLYKIPITNKKKVLTLIFESCTEIAKTKTCYPMCDKYKQRKVCYTKSKTYIEYSGRSNLKFGQNTHLNQKLPALGVWVSVRIEYPNGQTTDQQNGQKQSKEHTDSDILRICAIIVKWWHNALYVYVAIATVRFQSASVLCGLIKTICNVCAVHNVRLLRTVIISFRSDCRTCTLLTDLWIFAATLYPVLTITICTGRAFIRWRAPRTLRKFFFNYLQGGVKGQYFFFVCKDLWGQWFRFFLTLVLVLLT